MVESRIAAVSASRQETLSAFPEFAGVCNCGRVHCLMRDHGGVLNVNSSLFLLSFKCSKSLVLATPSLPQTIVHRSCLHALEPWGSH